MLKQTVQYKDFDGNDAMETLYFNITQTEAAENLHLQERFQRLEDKLGLTDGKPDRQLTPEEIQEVLDLVKILMKLAYGVRSDDGKRFIKTDQIWEEFTQTAVYDAFLMGLFRDPEKANDFMLGVFPQEMREEAARQAAQQGTSSTPDISLLPEQPAEPVVDNRPAYVRENRQPTQKELTTMSKAEFLEAMEFKQKLQQQ